MSEVKASEIEGILYYVFKELFAPDHCYLQLLSKFPENVDDKIEIGQQNSTALFGGIFLEERAVYFLNEQTSRLYYYKFSNHRKCALEEIKITDITNFKKTIREFMGDDRKKSLDKDQINKLITANTNHVPDRYINQKEANRFLRGSRELVSLIHDKNEARSNRIAFGLTFLFPHTCCIGCCE